MALDAAYSNNSIMTAEDQTIPEGILIFNSHGQLILVNEVAYRLFKYDNDELLGTYIDKIIQGGLSEITQQSLLAQHTPRTNSRIKLTGVSKAKSEFSLEARLTHFQSDTQHFTLAYVIGVTSQIPIDTPLAKNQTEHLVRSLANVETINRDLQLQIQKRKETEQKLIKFQRLYDTMVHNFPDGVIGVLNREMEYVLIDGKDLNEIDLPALGLTAQKTSNSRDKTLAEETITKIRKAFDGQNISFEVKTKDRYYNIAAVPLPDERNNINEILCVLINVTEKNKAEEVLVKALEKEKELGELKSRFVTMACHEFKTPLTTILSSTFLLENYSGEEFEKEKLVHTNRIKRSVNNLTMILNEFLSLEKLEQSPIKIVKTNINIPKYISELISEQDHGKQNGHEITYQHSGDQEAISIDQPLLWSIITNLISNARKYSKPGDSIHVSSEISNNFITIRVKDQGIGIPAEEHAHIFERFHRASNATNFEGTGLGLHLAEKNVKLLNGKISFTSQLNVGTEFTVVLPFDNSN